MVDFPFERGKVYPISDLRAFERQLSAARQKDPGLSADWRVPPDPKKKKWVKIREETYPIKLLADHKLYPDDSTFYLMPEGYPEIDAKVDIRDERFNLQITIADPIWAEDGDKFQHGGYDHRLLMEGLNRNSVVVGSGRFCRNGDGDIVSRKTVRSAQEEFTACAKGF